MAAQEAGTTQQPAGDLITVLQEKLLHVSHMLYNYLGAMQRDAQPVSVRGEPKPAPLQGWAGEAPDVRALATEIAQTSKEVDTLLQSLPGKPARSRAQQLLDIAGLQRVGVQLDEELREVLSQANERLSGLQAAADRQADAVLSVDQSLAQQEQEQPPALPLALPVKQT